MPEASPLESSPTLRGPPALLPLNVTRSCALDHSLYLHVLALPVPPAGGNWRVQIRVQVQRRRRRGSHDAIPGTASLADAFYAVSNPKRANCAFCPLHRNTPRAQATPALLAVFPRNTTTVFLLAFCVLLPPSSSLPSGGLRIETCSSLRTRSTPAVAAYLRVG